MRPISTLRWMLTLVTVGVALLMVPVPAQIRPAPGASPNVSTAIGTLAANHGGTGQSSFTIGDLLYASSSSAISKLAAVATGQVLVSAGTGTAPAYSATPSVTSLTVKVGGGSGTAKAGGIVCQDITNPDTSTQNAWNYKTCTVPAAALVANGDQITCDFALRFATNANTKAWQFYSNGGTCSGNGAAACGTGDQLFASSTTGSAIRTFTHAIITRTGSNAQSVYGMTSIDTSFQTSSVVGTATESGSIPVVVAYRNESAAAATTNTLIAPTLTCAVKNF